MPRLRAASTVAGLAALFASSAPLLAQTPVSPPALKQVASFQHQATGIAVTKDGRIFVSFPRWTEDSAISVGELKDGKVCLIPMPR